MKPILFIRQIRQWIRDELGTVRAIETKTGTIYAITDIKIHVGYGYENLN